MLYSAGVGYYRGDVGAAPHAKATLPSSQNWAIFADCWFASANVTPSILVQNSAEAVGLSSIAVTVPVDIPSGDTLVVGVAILVLGATIGGTLTPSGWTIADSGASATWAFATGKIAGPVTHGTSLSLSFSALPGGHTIDAWMFVLRLPSCSLTTLKPEGANIGTSGTADTGASSASLTPHGFGIALVGDWSSGDTFSWINSWNNFPSTYAESISLGATSALSMAGGKQYANSIALGATAGFLSSGAVSDVTLDEIGRIVFGGYVWAEQGRLDTNGPLEEHGRFIFRRRVGNSIALGATAGFSASGSLTIRAVVDLIATARFAASVNAIPLHEAGMMIAVALISCDVQPELAILAAAALLIGTDEQTATCDPVRDLDSSVLWEH